MSIDTFNSVLDGPATINPEYEAVVLRMIRTQPDAETLADMLGIGDAA